MYNYSIELVYPDTTDVTIFLTSEVKYTTAEFGTIFNDALIAVQNEENEFDTEVVKVADYLVEHKGFKYLTFQTGVVLEDELDTVNDFSGVYARVADIEDVDFDEETLQEIEEEFTTKHEENEKECIDLSNPNKIFDLDKNKIASNLFDLSENVDLVLVQRNDMYYVYKNRKGNSGEYVGEDIALCMVKQARSLSIYSYDTLKALLCM